MFACSKRTRLSWKWPTSIGQLSISGAQEQLLGFFPAQSIATLLFRCFGVSSRKGLKRSPLTTSYKGGQELLSQQGLETKPGFYFSADSSTKFLILCASRFEGFQTSVLNQSLLQPQLSHYCSQECSYPEHEYLLGVPIIGEIYNIRSTTGRRTSLVLVDKPPEGVNPDIKSRSRAPLRRLVLLFVNYLANSCSQAGATRTSLLSFGPHQ